MQLGRFRIFSGVVLSVGRRKLDQQNILAPPGKPRKARRVAHARTPELLAKKGVGDAG